MPVTIPVRKRLPAPVEAVLFDMDGLLFDTERIYAAVLIEAASAIGYDMPETLCHALIGTSGPDGDDMIRAHFGEAFPFDALEREWEVRRDGYLEAGIPIKPGALELLTALEASSLPRAIVTSSSRRTADRYLERSNLRSRFITVVTREDVERAKPFPDPYLKAARDLGVLPQHCVVLEDSHPGIRAAHAASAMPVFVPDLVPPTPEIRALCVGIAADLHEVRRMILGG